MEPNGIAKVSAYSVVALAGALLGSASSYYHYGLLLESSTPTSVISRQHLQPLRLNTDAIQAQAAVVYDPSSGNVLFAKNAQAQLPLASLTKLATAYAALSVGNAEQSVEIALRDLKSEGDTGLRAGDIWRLADLVAFGLTTSSNDAMAAVASALSGQDIVEEMNREAQNAHLEQTYFLNPTGLDISSSTAGAYGSALDVAHLVDMLLRQYPSVFQATTDEPKLSGSSGKGAEATTQPLWDMPGLIAAKTGYTDLAGGNLAVAVDLGLGEPVVVVVLGSTQEGRFSDVRTLVETLRSTARYAD